MSRSDKTVFIHFPRSATGINFSKKISLAKICSFATTLSLNWPDEICPIQVSLAIRGDYVPLKFGIREYQNHYFKPETG